MEERLIKSFAFKHEAVAMELLNSACDCPPNNASTIGASITAYRYVFADCQANSFVPQAVSHGDEHAHRECEKCCEYLSLSLYVNPTKAKKTYTYLNKKFKNFRTRSGSHLAKGVVDPSDGLMTQPDSQTHFSLFESDSCNLAPKFVVIEALK